MNQIITRKRTWSMVDLQTFVLPFLSKHVRNRDVLFFALQLGDMPFEGCQESSAEFFLVDGYPCYLHNSYSLLNVRFPASYTFLLPLSSKYSIIMVNCGNFDCYPSRNILILTPS